MFCIKIHLKNSVSKQSPLDGKAETESRGFFHLNIAVHCLPENPPLVSMTNNLLPKRSYSETLSLQLVR